MYKTFLSIVFVFLLASNSVMACGFHNYVPQPSMVDRLMDSENIVLARAAPDNPFRFEVTQTLEGGFDEAAKIPFLVDSATRRRLALDRNAAVLFARDGAYGPWQRVAFVNAAMAPVLDTIMARMPTWELGEDVDRFRYFATLVGHPDERIHRLALRELDVADYEILRGLPLKFDSAQLLGELDDPYKMEAKPISILLLGLSGDDHLAGFLEQRLEQEVSSGGIYIGAFATALIETSGPDAVTAITSRYLVNRDHSLLTRELLIEAIALHGSSTDAGMESIISGAIENAIWVDPDLGGAIARQFSARGDWSHYAALRTLIEGGNLSNPTDKIDVVQYVTLAAEFTENH